MGDGDPKIGGRGHPVRPYLNPRYSDIHRHSRQHYQEYIPTGGMYVVYERSGVESKSQYKPHHTLCNIAACNMLNSIQQMLH